MTAVEIVADEACEQGIPLDIEPLLTPYLQQGQLSVRVERLPPRSRLSKGRNNGDATFSLKPDDLKDLVFFPAEDANGSAVTLAVRVVKLESDYATTLAVIDLPVVLGTEAKIPAPSAPGLPAPAEETVDDTPSEPAKLTAEAVTNKRRAFGPVSPNDPVEFLKLQRAFDVLSASLAETEARAEHAERKAEEAEARLAELESGGGGAEVDPEQIRAEISKKYEQELAELKQRLDTAARELEKAHNQALTSAEASYASELEQNVAAVKKQLTEEFDLRHEKALREAEAQAAPQAEKDRQTMAAEAQTALSSARESWKSEEAQRLDAAKAAYEAELSDLRERFTAAAEDIETARKQATETAGVNRAREIADLQSAHAQALEENAAATKAELERTFEPRLARARREAEQTAARDLSEAKTAFESEVLELRAQLKTATDEIAKVREREPGDSDSLHADEIEALQRTHANDLEEKVAQEKDQLEAEFAKRLAETAANSETEISDLQAQLQDATGEIEELRKQASTNNVDSSTPAVAENVKTAREFEARLLAERVAWKEEASADLAKARASWKKAEEQRLAETKRGMRVTGKSGRGRKVSTRWAYNSWLPRRSRVIGAAIICLFALFALHPDTRSLFIEYSTPAVAEVKGLVEPVLNRALAAIQATQPESPAPVRKRAVIGVESANIRVGPSTQTNVVGSMPRGGTVVLLDSQGDWLRVRFGAGQVGWIYRGLLNENAR